MRYSTNMEIGQIKRFYCIFLFDHNIIFLEGEIIKKNKKIRERSLHFSYGVVEQIFICSSWWKDLFGNGKILCKTVGTGMRTNKRRSLRGN